MAIYPKRRRPRSGSPEHTRPCIRIDVEDIRRITILPAYQTVRFSPGSQISFRASDQNGNDITQLLTWESMDPQRLRAEQGMPGVFTPLVPGRAQVHAYCPDSRADARADARGPAGETEVMIQSTQREAA